MKIKKDKNFSNELRNNHDKNSIDKLDTPMKIYDYQNRVHMIHRRIKQVVKEEQKNIEKQLTKFDTNFQSFTSRNFYKDYKKFSDKCFKTTNLVDNIAERYQEKGYNILNLNYEFYKINPLLDSNVNKLFISYLFNKSGEKFNYDKIYRKDKRVNYMKKLKNIISPEKNVEEKQKLYKPKKIKKKNKKYSLLTNNGRKSKYFSTEKSLFIDNKSHKNNKEEENKNKSSNSINIVHYFDKKKYAYDNQNNYNLFNKNTENKIKSSKNLNIIIPDIKTKRNSGKHDSNENNLKIRTGLFLNITSERNQKKYSSNNLTLLSLNYNSNNNISNTTKTNTQMFLNTEKIADNKTKEYILDTPKVIDKNKLYINQKNISSYNTNPYSSSNKEDTFGLYKNIPNTKTKNSLKSFKIKEFSVNSKSDKISASSKKLIITEYNNKNIFTNKNFRYSYTINKKEDENFKAENLFKDASISSENKKQIDSHKKEEDINQIYKQLKAGKCKNIEDKMKNYLFKTKKLDKREIDFILKKYEYKNIKSNFSELKKFISEKKISKKIERIYLNNHDYNRIEPLMNIMNNNDYKICKLESQITKIYNKS